MKRARPGEGGEVRARRAHGAAGGADAVSAAAAAAEAGALAEMSGGDAPQWTKSARVISPEQLRRLQHLHLAQKHMQRAQSPLRKVRKAPEPAQEHNSVLLGRDKGAAGPKAPVKAHREVRLRTVSRQLCASRDYDKVLRLFTAALPQTANANAAASSSAADLGRVDAPRELKRTPSSDVNVINRQQNHRQRQQQQQYTPMRKESLTPRPLLYPNNQHHVLQQQQQLQKQKLVKQPQGYQQEVAHALPEVGSIAAAGGPGSTPGSAKVFREARWRAERRKLRASLKLAELHLQELSAARQCTVCQASLAQEQAHKSALSCMRAKRDFLTVKLRKLDRTIHAHGADAAVRPAPVHYTSLTPREKIQLQQPASGSNSAASSSSSSSSSSSASSTCGSASGISAAAGGALTSFNTTVFATRADAGGAPRKTEEKPNGPNVRLGYVNYFRSLRSEGMTNKSCPVCTSRLDDMGAFLSTLDRLSFLANQRFFDESSD